MHNLAAVETQRLTMQGQLDRANTPLERNKLGQFATPPQLALDMARYMASLMDNSNKTIHFADPTVGTGAFFWALSTVFPKERIGSAVGIEIDPTIADAARNLWASSGLKIINGDLTDPRTRSSCSRRPNLILANPPYVRHHHLGPEQKARLRQLVRQETGVHINGLAGLYIYCLLLATSWLEEDGLAAWLIPSEFMDVNYGQALKQFLTRQVTLLRVHRFNPLQMQFDDALVSSSVVVFRKRKPTPESAAELTYGGTVQDPLSRETVRLADLIHTRKWTTYPSGATTRHRGTPAGEVVLGDLFTIRRGIATGANGFFILDREDARARGLPDQFLRPILPAPRRLRQEVIQSDKDGYPQLEQQLCLIDCALPEAALQSLQPRLWEYLQSGDSSVRDGYLVRQRRPWYKQEQRAPAPFLCTYMGRSSGASKPFRFIWNRSKAVASNLYLMLYPCGALARLMEDKPELQARIFELLGRIDSSDVCREGRVYGGGLHKVEPKELGRVSADLFLQEIPQLRGHVGVRQAQLLTAHGF